MTEPVFKINIKIVVRPDMTETPVCIHADIVGPNNARREVHQLFAADAYPSCFPLALLNIMKEITSPFDGEWCSLPCFNSLKLFTEE